LHLNILWELTSRGAPGFQHLLVILEHAVRAHRYRPVLSDLSRRGKEVGVGGVDPCEKLQCLVRPIGLPGRGGRTDAIVGCEFRQSPHRAIAGFRTCGVEQLQEQAFRLAHAVAEPVGEPEQGVSLGKQGIPSPKAAHRPHPRRSQHECRIEGGVHRPGRPVKPKCLLAIAADLCVICLLEHAIQLETTGLHRDVQNTGSQVERGR
jgi:hypothetical protein